MEENNIYYLEEAAIPKAVANMSIPMILAMFVGVIQNITDTFFIGKLNDSNLVAAVMLAMPVFTIFMATSNIFGVGCGTYISRLLGERDYENAKYTSSFSFYACLVIGLILTILCFVFMDPVMKILGTSSNTINATRSYTRIIAGGGSLIMLSFSMSQIVRAEGSAKQSMVGMMIGTVGNIILDPIMIFVLHLGVVGAAYATVLANGLAVIYYGWYFVKKSEWLTISIKYFTFKISIIKNSLSIGMPVFITFLLLLSSSVLLNNFAASYGDATVAILGIAIQINMIPEFIVSGLCEGVQPLIGYNYASNNRKRMNEIIKFTGICAISISIFIATTLYFSSGFIIRMFISNTNIIKLGTPLFHISMLAQIVYGVIFLLTSVFQSTGKAVPALLMSISQGMIFIPALIIGNSLFGLTGVAYALPISEFGTAALSLILYLSVKNDLHSSTKAELQ
jgi:multidrug efflux pump